MRRCGDAAMRANYSTTAKLEARQSLLSHVTGVEGTHVHDLVERIELESLILDVGCGNGTWLAHAAKRARRWGWICRRRCTFGGRGRAAAPGAGRQRGRGFGALDAVPRPRQAGCAGRGRPGAATPGRLIVATKAASEHGPHSDIIRRSLTDVLGRPVGQWLEPLDFNEANGADILRAQFPNVDRYRWEVRLEVSSPEPLVAYLDSGRTPIEDELGDDLLWDDILARAAELTRIHLPTTERCGSPEPALDSSPSRQRTIDETGVAPRVPDTRAGYRPPIIRRNPHACRKRTARRAGY